MSPVLTEQQWQDQIDAEAVAQATGRPWPDMTKVRRVPIYDGPARTLPEQMAHQRTTEADDGTD